MLQIKKLDKLILKAYITPLLITFFVTTFLFLMQFLWKYIDDLVGKGLEWSIVLELLFYATVGLFQMSLPVAVLCSSLFLYSSFGDTNELMAIKAAGISFFKTMRSVLILNIFIVSFSFVYVNNLLPYANLRLWSLMYDVRNQRPELNIKEGIFFDGIDHVRLKIKSKNPSTNMMYDVIIYDHRKNYGNTHVTIADSAFMKLTDNKQYLVFTLYNGKNYEDVVDGVSYEERRKNRPFREQYFSKQQIQFELESFEFSRTDRELFKHNSQMQNLSQLVHSIDSSKSLTDYRNDRSFYHYYANYIRKAKNKNPKMQGEIYNVDSLFATYNNLEKIQCLSQALNYVRSAESYLLSSIDNKMTQQVSLSKHNIELHRKFTFTAIAFIMFFIGAPFGAMVRKGGMGVPVIFTFVFYLLYYILSMIGEKSIKTASSSLLTGMWFPVLLLVGIAIYFSIMAARESTITFTKFSNLFSLKFLKKNKQ